MSASARLTLSDLAALKRQIDHERREAAQRQQREKEARQKAERERRLFKLSVGDITPLHDAGKVLLQPPPPEPVPRQRELDEQRGQWAIQSQIDLHGLRRDEARESLQAFLRLSRRLGHRCVRVVHGKGLGSPGKAPVLKSRVRAWLIQSRAVLAFVQARASQGGNGAVVVLLAPPEHPGQEPR